MFARSDASRAFTHVVLDGPKDGHHKTIDVSALIGQTRKTGRLFQS